MKRKFFTLLQLLALLPGVYVLGQQSSKWTEADRKFLVDNLARTRAELISQTQHLSLAQWEFKEDSTQWSIGQVLEHLGLYERIFAQEADIMLSDPPNPELEKFALADSVFIDWMNDPSPHQAEWNAIPLGLMHGKDNLAFFLFGRDHLIRFIQNTNYDLKAHYTFRWGEEKRRSIHSLMVVHFAHTDRHLQQVARIKSSTGFP